ncbi:MAG: hypothetical protein ACJ78Y_15975 [Myxococcales bacterium]
MKNVLLSLVLGSFLAPAAAAAQASVDVRIGFPAPPPLVVVSPGIRVVPDYQEEVFFVNGWYWVRRDAGWYRTRDHRGGWVPVHHRYVPAGLVRIPPGQYRHWHKEERKSEKRAFKEARKESREREKADRRDWKDDDHGRGHGKHH